MIRYTNRGVVINANSGSLRDAIRKIKEIKERFVTRYMESTIDWHQFREANEEDYKWLRKLLKKDLTEEEMKREIYYRYA